jgi:acyl-CoA reductase-like NAD-dependent aldehyde dehydrogenase
MATAPGTRMFADGDWCDAASGATVEATSPATGELLGPVAEGKVDELVEFWRMAAEDGTLTELQTVLVKA